MFVAQKTIEKILLDFEPEEKNLLPALKEVASVFGFIDENQADKIAAYFSLPLTQVFETGSFYSEIRFEKKPMVLIEICSSPNCAVNDSWQIIQEIQNHLGIKLDDTSNDKIQLRTMSCLGRCAEGPIVRVNGEIFVQVDKGKIYDILKKYI